MLIPRYLLPLALCLAVALPAQASEPVATDEQGNTFHLDTAGMHRKGYVVYVWTLKNLARADAEGALSIRTQVEFDCRFRQTRSMWETLYGDRNEAGTVIRSGMVTRPEWVPVVAGSPQDALLDQACRSIMR